MHSCLSHLMFSADFAPYPPPWEAFCLRQSFLRIFFLFIYWATPFWICLFFSLYYAAALKKGDSEEKNFPEISARREIQTEAAGSGILRSVWPVWGSGAAALGKERGRLLLPYAEVRGEKRRHWWEGMRGLSSPVRRGAGLWFERAACGRWWGEALAAWKAGLCVRGGCSLITHCGRFRRAFFHYI